MADTGRGVKICDDRCGCTVPCTDGNTCRCSSRESGGGDHSTCPCGEHCGCNPCGCPKNVAAGAGCKCGGGCTCASCHA